MRVSSCSGFVCFELSMGTRKTNGLFFFFLYFLPHVFYFVFASPAKGEGKICGLKQVNGQRSKMESDLLLQFTPMLD